MLVSQTFPIENHNTVSLVNQSRLKPKILVVDDEPLICRLYDEVLTETGFEVDTAQNGASAWTALQSKKYDLVITDNKMPALTGIELVMKIHRAHLTMPVILTSGTSPSEDFIAQPWLKPDLILIKPYGPAKLIEAVRQVLSIA